MKINNRRRRRPAVLCAAAVAVLGVLVGGSPATALGSGAAPGPRATPVLSQRVIGYSVRHRPIVAYHLGDPSIRRVDVLIGQMHGDEHAGVTVAESLIDGSRAVEGVNLWVIPTMNPDGDAAHTRQNADGVDLNRNWPDHWRPLTGEYYSGTGPLSEPETRAMRAFLRQVHPHYLVVLHQPLDGVDTTDGGAIARTFVNTLSRALGLPEKAFNCWSFCYGSMTGWYTTHRMGIAETIEFGWTPAPAYLVGRAPRGIVGALGGHFGPLARHNPVTQLSLAVAGGTVRFTGWAYDIDRPGNAVFVRAAEGSRVLAGRWAQLPSTGLDHARGLTGGHAFDFGVPVTPGPHRYCLVAHNLGAGTGDGRTCASIVVPAAS